MAQIGSHTVKSGSTLQGLTALSVGEAEFYALVKEGQVGLSFRSVYADLAIPMKVETQTDTSTPNNNVSGPKDAIVSEMIKKLPMEKSILLFNDFRNDFWFDGIFKLVENCETVFCEKTGRGTEERNQKLQSNCVDIGDVKVVCILYHPGLGEGKGACKMERPTCWRNGWNNLPTHSSVGEFSTKTPATARRKESRDETWYSGETDNVPLGHQDGLR